MLDTILLEKAGIPAVAIVTDAFEATGRAMASTWGVPDFPFLSVPHPIANLNYPEIDRIATDAVHHILCFLKGETSDESV